MLGYIQVLDGERDPRNLLLAFNSVFRIIHNLRMGPLVEDLFDVISCYFPVDFTPVSLLILFYCIKTWYFSLLMSQQQFPEKPLFRVSKSAYLLRQSLPRLSMLRLFILSFDLWLSLVVLCSTFT